MKNCYFAATVEQLVNGTPKYYDYVIKVKTGANILSVLETHGAGATATEKTHKLINADYCETKKQAADLVTFWRRCHAENGTALFDNII